MSARREKMGEPLPDKANTIPAMLGGRVRKRRMSMAGELPSKRVKTSTTIAPAPMAKVAPALVHAAPAESERALAASSAKPTTPSSSKSVRQLRLSEMLKRDRQKRFELSAPAPSIIRAEPHMDTRRPSSSFAPSTPTKRAVRSKFSSTEAFLSSPVSRHPPTPTKPPALSTVKPLTVASKLGQTEVEFSYVSSSSLASTRIRASGSEAITYSRAMLPSAHALLLDIFLGLETAVTLLRTRKELSTFAAVKSIVARSSKRQFTFRHLSQLAHLVPEALCVLPSRNARLSGRDHLILRLDDVNADVLDRPTKKSLSSFIGGNATRTRRKLLHDRLLEHVREHHTAFLKKLGVTSYESHMWHQDFDLETHVPQLGAPPLYPVSPPTSKDQSNTLPPTPKTKVVLKQAVPDLQSSEVTNAADNEPENGSSNADSDDAACIPASLLEKVRARSRVRNDMAEEKAKDYRTNPDYIARLPATMDTIASIFRSDRRSAFGWSQLVARLVKLHPRKWAEDEIERQLNSIAETATEWCAKVKLGGTKVRFAFRLLDEKKFASQRLKVAASLSQ